MTAQFARTPYRARSGGSSIAEPHAALLIDFDNVTMGIRSDLTKELKALLNSDIIKGKVAVQRAYADWRRYPQYIVPLAESSVDLIYAPAYGSAKKNATDIRLAIDALELVFTRPEIGTFILLSGDSDFSSLVLKLKEYGKYVIGVGIRESASDLLVQNCDEYYSYSALTGLTRAGEELPAVSADPWELVDLAIRQMADKGDVMRSDRLKQVLLDMDPGFDEKALGFQKFNKFLHEAATRGIIELRKLENGQFEVELPSGDGAPAAEPVEVQEPKEGRRSRGRRGRGKRETAAVETAVAEEPVEIAVAEPVAVEPVAAERIAALPATVEPEPVSEAAPVQPVASKPDLGTSYELLRRAVADLVRKNGAAVRDSDVKRRMLELSAGWDESELGFSKFSRFLRQAHDAEVITLRRIDGGNYEVMPGDGAGPRLEPAAAPAGRKEEGGRGRSRRGGRKRAAADAPTERATRTVVAKEEPAAVEPSTPASDAAAAAAPSAAARAATTAPVSAPAAAVSAKAPVAPPPSAFGFRRGSRGRTAPSGPPPLLEGQAARLSQQVAAAPAPAATEVEAAPSKPAQPERTRGKGKSSAKHAAKTEAAQPRAEPRPKAGAVDVAGLGLPREAGEIANYIVTNYRGVGPRSVQTLIEHFGATRVWDVLETRPDEVRAVIGASRGDRLLEAWRDDIAARRANAAPPEGGPARAGKRATQSGRARPARRRSGASRR